MSQFVFLLAISLVLGTILLVFGMKYFSGAREARSRAASENAYRDLAAKGVAAQSENANSLSAIQSGLSEIHTRLAVVEKILKAVE